MQEGIEPTFAIITTSANELVAEIYDRMPLILAPGRLCALAWRGARDRQSNAGSKIRCPLHSAGQLDTEARNSSESFHPPGLGECRPTVRKIVYDFQGT